MWTLLIEYKIMAKKSNAELQNKSEKLRKYKCITYFKGLSERIVKLFKDNGTHGFKIIFKPAIK